ncbi:PVC-type heme-binding CxxCH protein [Arenibacter sp. ARW7G5Y1]|uniref:PVC-type heme-binding CxxCH protein n=1 Tax=Arenibacter sp. ARW7G5Y1 TaxID=2135619 RepID=UPI000D8D3DC2|nr:PVC-type heme-binding CxxCH protein [Arenibacter sp. ARW7G5Y1]PXX22825.1 putative membrane-bound dehydrogenase-like protein [Arenibacter sp. ARW7G5Y1]
MKIIISTKRILTLLFGFTMLMACKQKKEKGMASANMKEYSFQIVQTDTEIKVLPNGETSAVVIQNVKPDFRPYIHPILAPGSEVELTQVSPGHHKHQTGLYWGFTRVNGSGASADELKKWFYKPEKPMDVHDKIGLDFFHNPDGEYWQKVSAEVLTPKGKEVQWRIVYNMLDVDKNPILKETQTWTFTEKDNKYFLSLEWQGEALIDITVNEFDYGGLFLRMPWKKGVDGEVKNAALQKNEKANGQRAMWVDAGMQIEGLEDWGHIAIFDHTMNQGYPQPWRVDKQFGVGPVLSKMGDWHIKKGEVKVFQHQVVAYAGNLDETKMNELWGAYVGSKGKYKDASLWKLAQQEGREAKFLSPKEAVEAMTVKEGYRAKVFASEPMITQPIAFCWDDKGRMWIAENRDYETRRSGFSGSGDSRILILEDTNHDGIADSKKIFMEGIPFPSAIAVGHGGVFIGAPPNLLFVPDKNGDDIADEKDIKVLLTGWGIRDRHETINSFHWGPDGWLYGLEGFATPSKIRKPKEGEGRLYKHRDEFPKDLLEGDGVDINGGVWRYHPLKDQFEVVAHGFSNPWGIDYDSKGQLFITACVIPHMFHVFQGGIYHRQGGQHFNPYVYEDIKTIVDHRHRSAHGGARIYQSDAFPTEVQGRLFMANIHDHGILSDILTPNKSGYTAGHGDDFMMANNAQFVGFSMEIGPAGNLYVLDWHDAEICGNDVLNKETGRVFRIEPEKSLAENWPGRFDDLNEKTDAELVELQLSKSNWHAQRARVILQYRASKRTLESKAIVRLNEIMDNHKNEDTRLRALWSLWITNNLNTEKLLDLLDDKDEYVRAWTIQFLVEDANPSSKIVNRLTDLAKKEASPVVRRYLAGSLQRMVEKDRWGIISELVQYNEDADDPNIPMMLWYGLEPLVAKQPERALDMARQSKIPSLVQKIARRLVDGNKMEKLIANIGKKSDMQAELLNGLLAGMEGNSDLREPSNWAATYKHLKLNPELSTRADEVAQGFGNAEIVEKMLVTLKDPNGDIDDKKRAIQGLASKQNLALQDIIPKLLEHSDLRSEVIKAIAFYETPDLGRVLFQKYESFNVAEKEEAIMTLASRPMYGRLLGNALKNGKISKSDIPAHVVLQLRAVLGNGFVEIWGPIDDISQTLQVEYRKYSALLTDDAISKASPSNGKGIFQRTCAMCHMLHGEGGEIGPDLTGSNRNNTTYLMSNILNPSGDVQDDYKLVVITTQNGRTYSGNIIGENDRNITLRVVGQDPVIINKSQILTKDISEKSMMPEGLLNNLTDKEVLDLIAYLKKLEPST